MGCRRVLKKRLSHFHSGPNVGQFLDDWLRLDRTTSLVSLEDQELVNGMAFDLIKELFHAFDLPSPPPMTFWN